MGWKERKDGEALEVTLNSSQWNRRMVNEAKSLIVRFLETLVEV